MLQEAGLCEGDYIVAVNGSDCKWAEHAEVVHALKSCSERGVELDVITLHTQEVCTAHMKDYAVNMYYIDLIHDLPKTGE